MARITAKIVGGNAQDLSADSVGALKQLLGVPTYQASINGSPSSDGQRLTDGDFVTLSPAVKGG